jgi:hypothetical protein
MKSYISIFSLITIAALFTGCGKSSSPQTEVNPADVTNNTLVNAKRTADKTIDVSFINQAIQLFNVQEGRYPKTLEELTPKYVAKLPDVPLGYKLSYDEKTGEVSVVRE